MKTGHQPIYPFTIFLVGRQALETGTCRLMCLLESARLGVQRPRKKSGLGSATSEPFDLWHGTH